MPVTVTYPGVYIEEIPSGVHTITGVATSIAACIDAFARGPLNTAVHLLSLSDFERELGGLNTNSEASYAIQQFFLNGGTEAYAVRVGGSAIQAAAIEVLDKPSSGSLIFTVTAGQMIAGKSVDNPGAWGNNLRVEVDYGTTDPQNLFNIAVSEVDPLSGKVLRSEVFLNLTMTDGNPNYALDVVNNGSQMVQLSNAASSGRPAATGTVGGNLPVPPPAAPVVSDGSTCTVTPSGGTSKTCTLALGGASPADYPSLRPFLEAAIRAADPNNPLLTGATVQLVGNGTSLNPYFFRILAGRGGSNFDPNTILTFSDTNTGKDILATTLNLDASASNPGVANIQEYSLGGTAAGAQQNPQTGVDDWTLNDTAIRGLQINKTGLYALDDVDLFNILCIPTAANLSPTSMQAVVTEATVYCDGRRAMFIVDIPSNVTDVGGMQTWMTQNDTLRDPNAAVYFPRVRIPDPLNGGRLRDVGPSGTLAGIWAATDVARGVWKAPAGVDTQLRNVPQLVYNLVDRENGVLNPLGINCLRNFPIYGNIAWGARTLYGSDVQASDWKYLPVRRLALFLEESLFRGTKWVVFEPNDEPLWAQIRLNVGAFMQSLFLQGAFQGQTPQAAYLVKCDNETTTQNDINQGIVNIIVGFAPLKPAEFVIIQIQQLAGQSPT